MCLQVRVYTTCYVHKHLQTEWNCQGLNDVLIRRSMHSVFSHGCQSHFDAPIDIPNVRLIPELTAWCQKLCMLNV